MFPLFLSSRKYNMIYELSARRIEGFNWHVNYSRVNWKVKIFESYESLAGAFLFSFVLVFGFNVMRRIYLASTFSRGKKNGFFQRFLEFCMHTSLVCCAESIQRTKAGYVTCIFNLEDFPQLCSLLPPPYPHAPFPCMWNLQFFYHRIKSKRISVC